MDVALGEIKYYVNIKAAIVYLLVLYSTIEYYCINTVPYKSVNIYTV